MYPEPCPHNNSVRLIVIGDYDVRQCRDCSLVFTGIKPKEADCEAEAKYEDFYQEKEGKSVRFFAPFEFLVKCFRLLRAVELWMLFRPRSVLDIGCGRGYTLYFLKKYFRVDKAVGTQISLPARKFAVEKLGLAVYPNDLLDIEFPEGGRFDVITLWHVLEHLPNPEGYIHKIYNLLEDEGTLFFQVPNLNSWTRKLTHKYWISWDVPYHLYHFDLPSLAKVLARGGFKITRHFTFSLEYATFTSAQSLASFITKDRNALYDFLQRRRRFDKGVLLQSILVGLLCLPCLIINLALYMSRHGEVTTVYANKGVLTFDI